MLARAHIICSNVLVLVRWMKAIYKRLIAFLLHAAYVFVGSSAATINVHQLYIYFIPHTVCMTNIGKCYTVILNNLHECAQATCRRKCCLSNDFCECIEWTKFMSQDGIYQKNEKDVTIEANITFIARILFNRTDVDTL